MNLIVTGLGTGMSLGILVSLFINSVSKRQKINRAKRTAESIIHNSRTNKDIKHANTMDKTLSYKEKLMIKQNQNQEEITRLQRKNQSETDQFLHQKKHLLQKYQKEKNKKKQDVLDLLQIIDGKIKELNSLKKQLKEKTKWMTEVLQKKFQINMQELKLNYQEKYRIDSKDHILQEIKSKEAYFTHHLNREAHFILERVLNRFCHPYSAERGIKTIFFSNPKTLKNLFGAGKHKIKLLEKECEVEMKANDIEQSITVQGLDPVQRELGRATLQIIAQKKHCHTSEIKALVQRVKRKILRQIKQDGDKICYILRLANIQPEVKNLMGALRYRYSFAQNQYFHCLEVGWLCGLLSSELALQTSVGRRAGMLHDIGKAIDHAMEGGHAMIGADIIQKHQEAENIVYAVRAHHHDVTPKATLDFLVIAADALSGARPGARRSTVDFYNQKVLTLEKIGRSFHGVQDTYIMSAGREMRVIVDSKKVNDTKALHLSKKIARRIEEECSYPGLIKVTVVRRVTCRTSGGPEWSKAADMRH